MERSNSLRKLANRKICRNYSIHPENVIYYDYFNNLKRRAGAQGCTNLVISFKKIMGSIMRYPLPIKNSLEAYKLKGVGKRFSYYFEKALSKGAQEKIHNSMHSGCVTSNENSSHIYTHINKVITSVDRFLKELDSKVYNLKIIGEESDDSIMRNMKEIRNDYSNSDYNEGEGKRRKRKGGKEKKGSAHCAGPVGGSNLANRADKADQVDQADASDCANDAASHDSKRGEDSYPPASEVNSSPQLTTTPYTYKNSTNISDYRIISGSSINYENSFLGDEETSVQKVGPPNQQEKKKRLNGKNKESKRTYEIKLNDFENRIMTFLEKNEHLYEDCSVSMEEITIGFLKYYRKCDKINISKLRRLIKLEFIEKVDICENKASGGFAKKRCVLDEVHDTPSSFSASNALSASSMSNSKRSKMKIINKVRLTVKGKEFLRRGEQKTEENPSHVSNLKPKEPTADASEGEDKSAYKGDKENKASESDHRIEYEDSFKSAEYLSTNMNESDERPRREVTYSDGENNHLFGKGNIVREDIIFTIDGDTSDGQSHQLSGGEDSEKSRTKASSTSGNLQIEKTSQCNFLRTEIKSNLSNNKQEGSVEVIDLFAEEDACDKGGDASGGSISLVESKTEGKRKWSDPLDRGGELGSEPKRRKTKKKGEKRLDEEEGNDHTRGERKPGQKAKRKTKLHANLDANPNGDTPTAAGEQVTYGPYEIVMVIDNRDISGTSPELNEKMKKIFQRNGIKYLTRNLPLGDIIWLCRRRVYNSGKSKRKRRRKCGKKGNPWEMSQNSYNNEWSCETSQMSILRKSNSYLSASYDQGRENHLGGDEEENAEYEEHVLKWIIERKTLNDLSASIIDGRYDEQKYRLMRSKETSHIIYLIENSNNSFRNYTNVSRISYETLLNAQHSIQLISGFSILTSQSLSHTFFLLAEMHTEIVENIRFVCNLREGEPIIQSDKLEVYLRDNSSEWDQWNNDSKKSKNNLVKEVFGKQLRLINMCGPDATEMILSLWPTPMKLNEALNKYTHDGILAEKIKRIYLKGRDLLGKRRVKSPVDANLIAQLRQLYAPDSI
ncbi:Uncharacterized protein PCOAH_00046240 [Plasmodium coatneyi]|uniref:Crossover junction endonuclease MUS81 n=1 Tax=Plasmodium coatneyi TaxID=208452 RepID=A0A1B1E435_9APIC|nr:Uncharacterized protein PCOAH_00046240 [Plasmodium coatneyi]ANQ09727.1 Uncharacterized protein PCOAH_00046240 [Plasmodium coatneyi]